MINIIKFINGEEVISHLQPVQGQDEFFMVDPCVIETSIDVQGNVKAKLYPIAFFSKDNMVLLNQGAVMYTYGPSDEILQAYEARNNKVVVPEKKIIV